MYCDNLQMPITARASYFTEFEHDSDELDDAAALLPTLRVVSSLNGHAGNCRGDEGSASDTRRCCFREDGDVGVLILVAGT